MDANSKRILCNQSFARRRFVPADRRGHRHRHSPVPLAIVAAALLVSGCYGGVTSGPGADDLPIMETGEELEGSEGAGEGGISGGPSDDGAMDDGAMDDGAMDDGATDGDPMDDAFAPPPPALRRLTVAEYRNSVRDLLGVEPPAESDLPPDDSVGGFTSIAARRLAMSPAAIEGFEELSFEIAETVFADPARREGLLGCEPAQADDACVTGFLTTFARRFYRRVASADELMRLTTVVENVAAASDIWTGLSYGVAALLQSPSFLYRVELGEPEGDRSWRRYTGFELASRLSFLLTGSTPDDALLDAAEAGVLDTPEGLRAHIDRLMASPRVQDAVIGFFSEQLRLDSVAKANKDPELFAEFGPELADAMRGELERLVLDWVWTQRRPVSELLVSPKTYVNDTLAEFYGIPASGEEGYVEWYRDEADPRIGLLGAAGLLAGNSAYAETSPTRRGRYVVEQLLCAVIPEPPPGTETNLPEVPAGTVLTMRERVELHMEDPTCRTCHVAMDPVGLPLEHFDAIGRYRETDHGLEIDASGTISGVPFEALRGLASTLADDPRVDACMVRRFYEFALGHSSGRGDRQAIAELEVVYRAAEGDFTELLRELLEHDAFIYAAEVNP